MEPYNFAGVYCDGDRVIALNLDDPRAGSPSLTGCLDPAIGKLFALAEFTVVPGRIIGALPETLFQLNNLRFIAVSRNFISGGIPTTLGQLRALRTLDLSYNQLNRSIPQSVAGLPALSNVILSHNRLSPFGPDVRITNPNPPDLKHNALSGSLSPTSLPPSLQCLSLSWKQLIGPLDLL